MADPTVPSAKIAELRRLLESLTDNGFYPLAYEQCGEKSSSIVIGTAVDKNNKPISGRCPDEYEGDDGVWIDTVAERSPFLESSGDEGMIRAVVAAVNALPALLDVAEMAAKLYADYCNDCNTTWAWEEIEATLSLLEVSPT